MFPADQSVVNHVELWADWLQVSDNVQMVAVAAQRLAAKEPSVCRDIIRGRIDRVSDPILLRVLAIALLCSGGKRKTVKSILERDPRNVLVHLALEDRGWSRPPVAADFDFEPKDAHEE